MTKNVQQSFSGAMSTWEQMSSSLYATMAAVDKVNAAIQSMASAYSNAELNATRLEVIMRQRMKSTDAEISSIKKLTSAQAELGIISAGVQRAGAQQLATFLYQKSSLEVLIPAMNNLVAQQRGFSAEAGDAVNVANLMGKAMMGMTSALRRVGITFTEAQEAAIKNGNEQERAAMLAQIITDNVGEMNAALAKTDAGKQKQLANSMGALKAKIGSLVSGIAPYLNVGASIANMAMGFMSLRNVVVAFSSKIGSAYMAFDGLLLKTMPFRARRVASSLPGPWRSMDAKYSHISAKSKSCMDKSSSLCDVRPSGCEAFVGSISVASLLLLSIRLLLVFDWYIVL